MTVYIDSFIQNQKAKIPKKWNLAGRSYYNAKRVFKSFFEHFQVLLG